MSNQIALTASILTWYDYEGQPQSKQLPELELHIGRHPTNAIVVPDPIVSRRHATIVYENLRHYVIDQSMAGTLLNGQRIPSNNPQLLNDDDVITISRMNFTFRDPFKTMSKAQFEETLGSSPSFINNRPSVYANGNSATNNNEKSHGKLMVNLEAGEVQIDAEEVALTPKEFALLALLFQHQERACPRPEIRRAVWPERDGDDEQAVSDEEIDGLVRRLRQKIELDRSNPRYIITVRQVRGYRFRPN